MKFQSGILGTATGVEEIEQRYKKEGEKYEEQQSHTVSGKELQIFQGNEPDMFQALHRSLFTPGHDSKDYTADTQPDNSNPCQYT